MWSFRDGDGNKDRLTSRDRQEELRAGVGSYKAPEVRGRTLVTPPNYPLLEEVYDKAEAWTVGFIVVDSMMKTRAGDIFERLAETSLEGERRRERKQYPIYPSRNAPKQPHWRYHDSDLPNLDDLEPRLRSALMGLLRCDCARFGGDRYDCTCSPRLSAEEALGMLYRRCQ